MKKEYRITEIPKSVPPMYELEEKRKGTWRHVCLSANRTILEGIKNDIVRQAAKERDGLRK